MADISGKSSYGSTEVRLLEAADLFGATELLSANPDLNLFILGDIENHGADAPFQDVWGEYTDGVLTAALLRYYDNFVVSKPGPIAPVGFRRIVANYVKGIPREDIDAGSRKVFLSGSEPIVRAVAGPIIEIPESAGAGNEDGTATPLAGTLRTLHFARIRPDTELPAASDVPATRTNRRRGETSLSAVRAATSDDVDRVVELYEHIEDFESGRSAAEAIRASLRDGSRRMNLIEDNRKVVSTASTAAENSRSAMIVGVATHPDYRYRGLATSCMLELCTQVLSENKSLCLFYDNPEAGRIYRRIGFRETDHWAMFSVQPPAASTDTGQ